MVSRFTIQRLTDSYGTEYYMNGDQWSEDRDDAEEFYTATKAQRRADRVGGDVCEHRRPAPWMKAPAMRAPIFLEAAE